MDNFIVGMLFLIIGDLDKAKGQKLWAFVSYVFAIVFIFRYLFYYESSL